METLRNDLLQVSVSAHGAEVQSIKDAQGHEYLWQGDSKFWGRRSPILFPIVCGLWKGEYRTEGETYHLGRHGFARDMDFTLVRQNPNALTYVLSSNDDTLRQYPYNFLLSVSYRLEGNALHVIWHVHNTDNKEIHFQIGAHPAFNLPGLKAGEAPHGRMRFDNEGRIERIYGNTEGCIVSDRYELPTQEGLWTFDEETFKDDAVIIDQCQVHSIALLDAEDKTAVTVDFKAPCVGLWMPYGKHAPFVCIEPWYGVHDHVGYKGKFRDKYLMNHLQPGASFMTEYVIRIGQTE